MVVKVNEAVACPDSLRYFSATASSVAPISHVIFKFDGFAKVHLASHHHVTWAYELFAP
jgi:hypothetical protein